MRHTRSRLVLATALALLSTSLYVGLVAGPGAGPAEAAGVSNKGALSVHNGDLTVTQDGTVIENLEIRGQLRIEANDVVVRNTWVYTSSFWTVYVKSGSATFDNVEIGHPSVFGYRGIGGNNVVMRNSEIHHVEDGIKLGSNSRYSGVIVRDLASPSSGAHYDAVQAEGTARNSVVENSVLDATGPSTIGNAAVILKTDFGPQSNLTFRNNYMNGGNYTIMVLDGGHGSPSDVEFTGNRFGPTRRYGMTNTDTSIGWSGNTWASNGAAIDKHGNTIGGSGSQPGSGASCEGTFCDDDGSLFEADIEKLVDAGITSGCNAEGDAFCPNDDVTRGQMAAFIARLLDLDERRSSGFVDIADSQFRYDIELLATAGITQGCNPPANNRYCPNDRISRQEVAALLVRALELTDRGSVDFVDDNGSIFEADIERLATSGITRGCNPPTNDRFCPRDHVTRGAMAAFIARAMPYVDR